MAGLLLKLVVLYLRELQRNNTIICNPITIENIDNENEIEASLKWLQIEYSLALGIKPSKKLMNGKSPPAT